MYQDPIAISENDLMKILAETSPGDPLFPELDRAQAELHALRQTRPARLILQASEGLVAGIEAIPQTTHSLYREYARTGYWQNYGRAFFTKRAKLTAAALRLFLGDAGWRDVVHDYIWNICEETTWIIPYHERHEVDLFSSETAAMLAQIIIALGDRLEDEVCQRAREEIERRVLQPYLERHSAHWWYKGTNNWNGVCNGSIGTAFLLLEEDQERLARALALILDGLDVFIHTAFEEDGASTEGASYWQYGLIHYVVFGELLRQRTQGRIELLASQRMKAIAAYPTHVMLSTERYANFADCEEKVDFHPGILNRLADRTGVPGLLDVLAKREEQDLPYPNPIIPTGLMRWNFDIALRILLWWDGQRPTQPALRDSYLPQAGFVKLLCQTSDGLPVVLAFKAGHNAENHNQNDVGSYILHIDGETFLCDPGRGLYDSAYFTDQRYENIFASSFGHSVPRVGGRTQSPGRECAGEILTYDPESDPKRVTAELAGAYEAHGLESMQRTITVADDEPQSGTVWVTDEFTFTRHGQEVEEAFVTWLQVETDGSTAIMRGQKHDLRLSIEEPAATVFALESFEEVCRANEKTGVLKRLSFTLQPARETVACVRIEIKTH